MPKQIKSKITALRLTESELKELKQHANNQGRTLSSLIYWLIFQFLNSKK
jgi:hypothetical protein